ncbi:hypothetical protein LG274_02715 [Micrococcus antarcticus]|uniref:hypothetical protein n=1 Tax=Micrococcus antarcticus TaxID=86171 RepID=UPI0038507DF2
MSLFMVSVWAQEPSGEWRLLPDASKISPDTTPDEVSSLVFEYPVDGRGSELLVEDAVVAVHYRDADGFWEEPRGGRFRLTHVGWDRLNRRTVTWTARSLYGDLDRAVLLQAPDFVAPVRELGETEQHYPRSWPAGSTVGQVLCRAIRESQARGELPDVDVSAISEDADSLGNPWTKTLAVEEHATFSPLVDLARSLSERGLCSVQFYENRITVLDPSSVGRDLSATVEIMPTRDITEAPGKAEVESTANRAYVKGDDGAAAIVEAPDIDPSRVRAVALDASGVKDVSTLRAIGALHLTTKGTRKAELTLGLDCWAARWLPWRDFDVDDLITVAYGNGAVETHRVRQITVDQDDKGCRAAVVVGDRMPDPRVEAMRRLRSMQEGVRARGARGLGAKTPTTGGGTSTDPGTDPGTGTGTSTPETYAAVRHNANANMPRPVGAVAVYWYGSVLPNNMEPGDSWRPQNGSFA